MKLERVPADIKRRARDAEKENVFAFSVEPEDNIGAVQCCPHRCAGHNALMRLSGVKDAWVGAARTWIEYEDGRVLKFRNPEALKNGQTGFDQGYSFPPGDYDVRTIEPSSRKGARKHRANNGAKEVIRLQRKRPIRRA